MQISDMKALKALYTHKPKIHFSIPLNPKSRHSSVRIFSSEKAKSETSEPATSSSRPVWCVYDPVSGDLVTQPVSEKFDEVEVAKRAFLSGSSNEVESTSDNIGSLSILGNEIELKGENNVSLSNLSNGVKLKSENSVSLSNLSNRVELKSSKYDSLSDLENRFERGGEKPKPRDSVSVGRVNSGAVGFGGKKSKKKSRVSWVCSSCGHSEGQWWGSCRQCGVGGSMKQFFEVEEGKGNRGFEVSENATKSWFQQQAGGTQPVRLREVCWGISRGDWRITLPGTFGDEVCRVLGGGVVPGSLILIGGDPGVGKSTLALQIAAVVAESHKGRKPDPVVYISGEESVEQIGNRAERMGVETEELFLYSSTDIEDILEKIQPLKPRAVVVDSIQTVYLKGIGGSAGGIYQVKECTSALLRFAKKTNIPVILIGHVNKSGDIAGPRVLEHIVDAVLYMEDDGSVISKIAHLRFLNNRAKVNLKVYVGTEGGEKNSTHRLLRSVKNRFGSTDELGVFEMSMSGLQAISNPSEMFLSEEQPDSDVFAGLAVAVIMDGSRSFLIEIQALSLSGTTLKQFNGVQASRADMIISVLIKQAGLRIQENAIFLNVVSGLKLAETAGDLAIAAAICSSFLEFPIPTGVAFIGEIGLGGEIRMVPRMEKRVLTVAKLGYRKCVVPKSAAKSLATIGDVELEIVGCSNLKDMINSIFITKVT